MRITIELTASEAAVLKANWRANLNYGASGTFGDGENLNRREHKTGLRILAKLNQATKQTAAVRSN